MVMSASERVARWLDSDSGERQREGMPEPNPVPDARLSKLNRLRLVAKGLALLSILIAAAAVVLAIRGGAKAQGYMMIATALAVGLTVLLGTAVLILTFLNSPTGRYPKDEDL